MAIETVNDLLSLALRDAGIAGVGQTALAEDINDAFDRCNMMLAQWQRKRWLVWNLVETSLVSTGAQSYTIGIGEDFDIQRPDDIESAFMRQLNTAPNYVDYPLRKIFSREDYNRIRIKSLTSFAQHFYYDPAYPVGRVFFWPIPLAGTYSLHIFTKVVIPQFTNLAQQINLPQEYRAAIFYNISARIREGHDLPPKPVTIALAREALNVIRVANSQIPSLRMPDGLVRRGLYDVYSDTSN